MTKADVIAQISEKTGVDKGDVQQTLESFFTVVKDSLSDGENLYVRGFGSFINKKRARKVARNIFPVAGSTERLNVSTAMTCGVFSFQGPYFCQLLVETSSHE